MKKGIFLLIILCLFELHITQTSAQTISVSNNLVAQPIPDRVVSFSVSDTGIYRSVLWGMDAGGWTNPAIWTLGARFLGAETINITRMPAFPTDTLYGDTLQKRQKDFLNERLGHAGLAGHPLQIMINPGGGEISWYSRDALGYARYALLMELTKNYIESFGHTVVSITGYNEPDYGPNGVSQQNFYDFIAACKARPGLSKLRFCGGNTLNDDNALNWYNFIKPAGLTEGNTHQLAGSFDSYAGFYHAVKANGNYATNDEVHDIMEGIVGAQYGLQAGIYWGYANLARGEFSKASYKGRQLGYAEHRPNFTAASVYRSNIGKLQAFCGASERQAVTTTYNYLSKDRDVYYEGYGPQREYTLVMPGGSGYMTIDQPYAERVINVTYGDDIQPALNGRYVLVNKNSGKVMQVPNGTNTNAVLVEQGDYTGAAYQQWDVKPVSTRVGGDFSYFSITAAHNGKSLDDYGFSLDNGAGIIQYDNNVSVNQQRWLEYVGDGYFMIRSRNSNKAIEVNNGSTANRAYLVQWEANSSAKQLWRFLPVDAAIEFVAPGAPANLAATANAESVRLNWTASPDADVAGYTIFRSESAEGSYNTIARNVPGTSFVDNTTATGGTFFYKIKAVDKSLNKSGYSNQVSATPTGAHDLVEYLPFNSTMLDTSINLNHSAAFVTPTYTTGKVGTGAVVLNGTTNFIQLPATVANQQEITIAAWVNWNGGANWQRIFDFGNGTDQNMFLSPASGEGTLRFAIKNGGGEQQLNAPVLPTGIWTHVAITLGATGATLYVNGQVVGQSNSITISPLDFKPVLNYIGRSQYPDPLFNGSIDEFKIFNYALSDSEIQELVTSSALPLTWGSFTADKKENTGLLRWTTLQEHNVSRFNVEKSIDGVHFTRIGTVNATGETTVTKNYSFTDATPVEGANYYRIQQTDKDGHFTFSIVRTLSFASLPFIITITPNPVKEMILVSAPGNNKSLQAVLLNSAGQKVDAFTIKGQNTTYNLSHHAAGVYYLQIQGTDVKISKKLIIDR